MVNVALSLAQVVLALALVVLNGFFVAAEFAFVRIRGTSVEQLAEEGRPGAGTLQEVMVSLDDYLATTQLGITIASLGLGWVGEPAVAALIEPVLEPILPAGLIHLVAFAIGFSIITFLHVVFGELAPKTLAIAQTERLSLFLAPPMKVFYYILYPGIVVFNGAANAFTRALGVPPASETDETLGERELLRVLTRSGEEGDIDVAEVKMIERVFDLDDVVVREVMVPRPDVVSVPADASLSDLQSIVLEAGHTRYPVLDADDSDQVIGFVDVKDVLRAEVEDGDAEIVGDIAREIVIAPETMALSDLLRQFREDQQQMAAVIDEWGAFEGIATVEDVVEALVGDLRDEFDMDEREPSIRRRGDEGYDIDGSVPLSKINDMIEGDFTSEEVETIGGLVLEQLNRAPERGDRVEVDGYVIEVTSVEGTRISTVWVHEREEDDSVVD
ncbi:hemolysin family protein [Haloplanus aerogenes]|uniref:CBS domain containing-hemolysin-like protein n=1 Tax=Haloplanus aerogenes TaxID=660522 RepID=A0A3M0D4E0_9EURY|nr:hemolysin family protein [Haloplanus aerogenes]AZH24838.1 HlyC/CorC family transporter [Haloplanus aerogenes]RMB13959.1 CBS domain containing-hemolysin-like protein [Haloplanus aerogenes]